MRDRSELASRTLHDLERSQAEARLGLGRASGLSGLAPKETDVTHVRGSWDVTVPPVDCPECGRNVAADPWSYDEPPRRWCQTCGRRWADLDGLAFARAEGATIHFSTPETVARKERHAGPRLEGSSLAQERRERAAGEKRRGKARRKRKAQRKARRSR